MNNTLILLLIAIIPEIIIGFCIYKMDKDKEPIKLLLFLITGGVLSCYAVLWITNILSTYFPLFSKPIEAQNIKEMLVYSFLCVGLIEEVCKFIFLYVISYNHKEFNYTFDMIVYGVFLSLGFATFENIFSVLNNGYRIGLLRAVTAVPLHACTGAFMGMLLSLAKQSEKNNTTSALKYKIFALFVPIVFHGIYDFCSFTTVLNVLITVIVMFSTVAVINVKIHQKYNKKI